MGEDRVVVEILPSSHVSEVKGGP